MLLYSIVILTRQSFISITFRQGQFPPETPIFAKLKKIIFTQNCKNSENCKNEIQTAAKKFPLLQFLHQPRICRTICSIISCSIMRVRFFSHSAISRKVVGRGFFAAYCFRSSSHISQASLSICRGISSHF